MNDVKFTGLFKPLDLINTIRFEYIKSMCSLKGKKILDLGCGMGLLANKLALHGARVLGVDQSKNLIDLAQKRSMPNIQYVNMNLLDIGDINDRFDIVICMEVLEQI